MTTKLIHLNGPLRDEDSAIHVRHTSQPPEIAQWFRSIGQGEVPILTLAAPPEYRQAVYGWCGAIQAQKWKQQGIRTEVVSSLIEAGRVTFLNLLMVDSLPIDGPLRAMVDQRFYLVSDLFRVILEARARVNEGEDPEPLLASTLNWIQDGPLAPFEERLLVDSKVTRRVQPTERLDCILFLFTLASQSGILDRAVLGLDRMDLATTSGPTAKRGFLKELDELAFGVTRWEKLGSSLGVILGVEHLPFVEESTKLGKLLRSGATYQPV